jgi:HNH endonuclease
VKKNEPGARRKHGGTWIVYTGQGWEYEARVIMERHLGRPLRSHEWVRHKNHDLYDNRLSNLRLLIVGRRRPNPWIDCACGCGLRLRKFDFQWRPRQFVHGHQMRVRRRKA